MQWWENIVELQFDATSYCNAGCGTCPRFTPEDNSKLNPVLETDNFPLDLFKRLIQVDIKNTNIKALSFNGNWGDAIMHPSIMEMIDIATDCDMSVKISTNGSIRTEKWWATLAQRMNNKSYVIFCIDGLDNKTHALYRDKTSFDKIIKNMTAFINAGGNAQWMMTAFDHNLHQIDAAEKMAKNLGCCKFVCRRSHEEEIIFKTHKVTTKNVTKEVYRDIMYRMNSYLDIEHGDEKCPWYREKRIQIDPFGSVWPCCYISQYRYGINETGKPTQEIFRNGTLANRFNLKHNTLKTILNDIFYTQELGTLIDKESLQPCRENCFS